MKENKSAIVRPIPKVIKIIKNGKTVLTIEGTPQDILPLISKGII